ncbi:FAD-dependent hydroxylase [Corticibacter populi]|uniref:FAD-dependent hydroxylase n=1 Tax=Corticibacter populi TaxID=1550736 RepID=A0A3M6QSE6_9BURK|nr:5-demethoxyubiquinol-8 5-hydroxylase UbiM [Corticibacter populi]RMX05967.1 FAD-dependent hydroxylase [Corticibacter populi]RZS30705.1 2-octaprenyl-3-methyl-6-methoxy-1,4-benzoquinol hydroxylase [Corticibacter populi]
MQVDIAIVGAGPVGLAFAQSMQGSGHSIALIDRQPLDALAEPAFDGREIALTHASRRILEELGAWQHIDPAEISQLRDAHIFNGASRYALKIDATLIGVAELGYFVPNHLIRKALFDAVQASPHVALLGSTSVVGVHTGTASHRLQLANGEAVQARLVVAADSRYSETRRMMGISADMHDFGRTMLVCRFAHEAPHHHISWQWFDVGQTLALLPLNGERSNVVLTLPPHEMQELLALDDAALSANITRRFAHRLGAMQKEGTPHSYPLVGAYARRFVAPRYALIGDAAVGMHPITAHGFNFGLQSQERLARQLWLAKRRHHDVADPRHLQAYERQHRLATWPLYQATNGIAQLYTDDRSVPRLLRDGALRLANTVQPFRRALALHLTQA